MKVTLILFFMIIGAKVGLAQIDTIKLKQEIKSLSDVEDVKKYLSKMYKEDQYYRGRQTNDSLDFEHLISMCYFINIHGYPKHSEFGEVSDVASLVWIHNKYIEIDRLTFPIILKGFLLGEINERDLRSYYMRQFYYERYDNELDKSIPLKEFIKICKVNERSKISIKEVLELKKEIDSLNEIPITEMSLWQSPGVEKTYYLDGKPIVANFEGGIIKYIEKENGKIYFQKIPIDNSGELREVIKIEENKFIYKNQETNKYFEFKSDKLIFRTKEKILKEYNKN